MDPISNPLFGQNPITNQQFGYDFDRFVLQNPHLVYINNQVEIKKPFNIDAPDKSEKSKKDLKKEKDKKKKNDNE